MRIYECIVVEGKSDTAAVRNAVEADTIETNGSAVSEEALRRIELAQKRRGIIILTDPDVPGERIRRIVSRRVPGCRHAFLTKDKASGRPGESLGVEHASAETIREALRHVRSEKEHPEVTAAVTRQELLELGLFAGRGSREKRARLGEILNIGYANGKQLLKRLEMFQISQAEFTAAYEQLMKEEEKE
ncbi:ribonuclease M5 [Marinococcus halophilus]|uniref:Ribonuclease M5 n=1 Tax=Marinococcus halophilus TaxID=1371 RepID=A0A510Y8S9_MARHA|nr:ribonuclease M5 [Marinococcus halophilus]OZT79221.1 ribonuclease M5 [Marinococcus halophilus]GEK59782.1 ribonuclease M5 [Marinococcus halophilus]